MHSAVLHGRFQRVMEVPEILHGEMAKHVIHVERLYQNTVALVVQSRNLQQDAVADFGRRENQRAVRYDQSGVVDRGVVDKLLEQIIFHHFEVGGDHLINFFVAPEKWKHPQISKF